MSIAPRCPEAQKVLQVQWGGATLTDAQEMDDPGELARRLGGEASDRPLLVYITGHDKKDEAAQKLMEAETFRDERFGLGARLFRLVKVDSDHLREGSPMARLLAGRKLPRLVVISRDGKDVRRLEGRTSASKAFGAMEAVIRKDLGVDLSRHVKSMVKLLNDLDGLSNERKQVAAKRADAEKKGRGLADVEKAEAELAAAQQRVSQEMEELVKQALGEKKATAQAR